MEFSGRQRSWRWVTTHRGGHATRSREVRPAAAQRGRRDDEPDLGAVAEWAGERELGGAVGIERANVVEHELVEAEQRTPVRIVVVVDEDRVERVTAELGDHARILDGEGPAQARLAEREPGIAG